VFISFGRNMWSDVPVSHWGGNNGDTPEKRKALLATCAADHVRFDEDTWRKAVDRYRASGATALIVDVGEALAYPSHPELHVKGSYSPERVLKEVRRLKALELEVVPKLNFSTGHDTWLKDYHRMVSTREYYQVCSDVIRDAYEAFDRPRYFHLGYDEEDAANQAQYGYCVVRQGELWWHDFLYVSGCVEKLGSRPWIWSDYCWQHEDEFMRRMPKSVLQSNWYYSKNFSEETIKTKYHLRGFKAFEKLAKAGFDQVPCGATYASDENFPSLVRYCKKLIAPERLKGFLLAPWCGATLPERLEKQYHAAEIFARAKAGYCE